MVTTARLEPVLDLIATSDDADTVLDAVLSIRDMDLPAESRVRIRDTFLALVDDPRLAQRRSEFFRHIAYLAVVRTRLAVIARDDGSPDQGSALCALAESDPPTWAGAYARWLLHHEPSAAEALAGLPLEGTGLNPGHLARLLGAADPEVRLFASVCAAKLGAPGPLVAMLDEIAGGNVPDFFHGSPFEVYARLAAAQPVPAELSTLLAARLEGSQSHLHDVVVWALTGLADAEGTVHLDSPGPAPAGEPGGAAEADALAGRLGRDGLAVLHSGGIDLAILRKATPKAAALMLERLVTRLASISDPVDAMFAGNALMDVVDAVPQPLPLRAQQIAIDWHSSGVLADDQLGALLALAEPDTLLDTLATGLRSPDSATASWTARALRLASEQRGLPAPRHGDGPVTRRVPRMAEAADEEEGFAMAGPPLAMAEPPATMAEPPLAMAEPPGASDEPAMLGTPAPAAAPAARRLRAQVSDATTGIRRDHAFAPGVAHAVGVHIGPGADGPLVAGDALPEDQIVRDSSGAAELLLAFVTTGVAGLAFQQHVVTLPATGPTKQVQFTLDVAVDATEVTASLVVYQGTRLIQSVEMSGPVADTDAPVAGRGIAFRRTADFVAVPVARSAEVDVSFAFHVGGAGDVLVRGARQIRPFSIPGLDAFGDQITLLLQDALAGDHEDAAGGSPGSDAQTGLLRGLARAGNLLFDRALSPALGDMRPERSVQITTLDDDVVPLEFVYDYGFPTETATLCAQWQQALRDGRCPTCKPRTGSTRTVCPLGFWGLRLTIERQLAAGPGVDGEASAAGQPHPGADALRDFDRVLFAASKKVDNKSPRERQLTIDLLRARLGDRCATADSWRAWRQQISSHRPGLLLTLPHNERAADGLPMLEIGAKSRLDVGAVTDDYVMTSGAGVGPVVLLLGCDTAHEDVPWQSAAAAFRRRGASVVIGTLVQTLGRQTAPTARLLVEALWGDDPVEQTTMGELIRELRRRLLLQGWTLGMSLVAFGDGDWRVRPKGA
jgi:hypothetical protein